MISYTEGRGKYRRPDGGFSMRSEQRMHPWESSTSRTGLVIAIAIHVAIIAAIVGSWHLGNFTAGDDSMDGTGDTAPLAGATVIPKWNTHPLVIMDEGYARLPSARIHLLLGDSMKVTAADGTVMYTVRAGTMFVVRVTRRGYEPLLLRLPNQQSEQNPREIRMTRLGPR